MSSSVLDFQISRGTTIGRIATSMTFYGFLSRLGVLGAVYGILWALWHISGFFINWVRIKRGLMKSNIPAGPSRRDIFSLFGRHDPHRVILDWFEQYGAIFHSEFIYVHTVSVNDPAIVAEVLRRSDVFDKPRFGYDCVDLVVSPHGNRSLVTGNTDDYWRLIRKGVMPAFSAGNLKHNFPAVQLVLSNLVRALKKIPSDQALDMDNVLTRESLDVIGRVGFGRDMRAIAALEEGKGEKTAVDFASLAGVEGETYMQQPLRAFKFWSADVREGKRRLARFHKCITDLLEDLKSRRSEIDPRTIAGHLLRIVDPKTGKPLTDEQLAAEIGIFFFGGFETTGHTLAWALYLLSQHPEEEAKVAAELAQLGLLAIPTNPNPRPVQWDDLGKLTYLNAVIKEATRLYPAAAAGTSRVALQDVVVGGRYAIPKGAMVMIPLFSFMRFSGNWEHPAAFIPERFLEKDAEIARKLQTGSEATPPATQSPAEQEGAAGSIVGLLDSALTDSDHGLADGVLGDGKRVVKRYLPFSEGPRSCAGMSLAKVNMAATLASLLGNFTCRLADEMGGPEGVRRSERMALTLSSCEGMKMHCIPRVPG